MPKNNEVSVERGKGSAKKSAPKDDKMFKVANTKGLEFAVLAHKALPNPLCVSCLRLWELHYGKRQPCLKGTCPYHPATVG